MKIIRDTNRISLRLSIALTIVAIIVFTLYAVPASAAPNPYKSVETTDTCREISEVRIRSGWWVDAIQLICRDGLKPRRGGSGGGLHSFTLRPGEYITGISGRRKGPAGNYVYALQIHTNLRSSPVYGEAGRDRGSKSFNLKVPRGHFVTGISTRSGRYLEQIKLKSRKIPYQVTHDTVIGHDCRYIAELRVRQTWWGSEIEVVCSDRRESRRNSNMAYRPIAPSFHDGRYISRNEMRNPGYTVYRQ